MRLTGLVSHMWEMRSLYKVFVLGNLKGRDHTEYLGVDRMIVLKYILR
jgi:hypothetical protein